MSSSRAAAAHPYLDAGLPIERRVADLLPRLTVEDKAGLLFHTLVVIDEPTNNNPAFGLPSVASMIRDRRMTHFNLLGSPTSGREFAQWQNAVQLIAADTPLGIPVTFSTDPRHAFTENPGTAMLSGPFSQWPEPLGLAAIGSAELVEQFADIVRREYLAVGLRVALHPQIDLATEPRWARAGGTFGEDADLTTRLVTGYIRGLQGTDLGRNSVATMVKHFPGAGPQKDGEDAHFPYGREQVYPGDRFDHHLLPFEAAIAAGGSQMMPYYAMPVGTEYEEVGFGFNRSVITGLLRERYGFEGIVCTDWGLITDAEAFGDPFPARAWGVEHLSREERLLKALQAGVDQFGGEHCPELVVGLLASGQLTQARVDESVRRILREKFTLGLFDDPYVDEDRADEVVGNAEFRAAGVAAQRRSHTLLTNTSAHGDCLLPLARGVRLYVEGLDPAVVSQYGTAVTNPADADVAIVRLQAPWELRDAGLEPFFHAGSLAFPKAELERLRALATAVPTVFDVYLDRPAILTELVDHAAAVIANYGSSDDALLTVLFGDASPHGSLPFDLPRSMAAVEASREDVPFDTEQPLFRFGHGLRYEQAPSGTAHVVPTNDQRRDPAAVAAMRGL